MAANRAILHVDLDAFYAQVEIVRLKKPSDTALVVVQWGTVLAVSYGARRFGIRRQDKVADVVQKSEPEVVTIVSVETIGTEGSSIEASSMPDQDDVKESQKVSLARYREASSKVFRSIEAIVDRIERASIDECFIDVTKLASLRLRSRARGVQACFIEDGARFSQPVDTIVVGGPLNPESVQDRLLHEAASIASEIRSAVWRDCAFTCSAGISVNKLLAKFASAENKPNKQTLCPFSAITSLLDRVPLRKLRGCGGKLGEAIEALGVHTAGEVRERLSMKDLKEAVGEKNAVFIWNIARGRDDSAVTERSNLNTLLAAKNFGSTCDINKASAWLSILARELVERLKFEEGTHKRVASSLTVSFRVYGCEIKGMTTVSRTKPMPSESCKDRERAIVSVARSCLDATLDGRKFKLPISFLGLTGGGFVERASRASIARYFEATTTNMDRQHDEDVVSDRQISDVSRDELSLRDPQLSSSGYASRSECTHMGTRGISAYLEKPSSQPPRDTASMSELDPESARMRQEAADFEYAKRLARDEHRQWNRTSPFLKRKLVSKGPPA
jgi:DNA polymerase eta